MPDAFELEGKQLALLESGIATDSVAGEDQTAVPRPLVLLNTFAGEAAAVHKACAALGCPPFTLACISGMDWNADLSPWELPPLRKNGEAFSGKADSYLDFLCGRALPAILGRLSAASAYLVLAGYSLAGLFALYAAHKTDRFSRIVAASPSAWFPRFVDFVRATPFAKTPGRIYLSLGDKESKTKNPLLATVQNNAESLADFYKTRGIKTVFELNRGKHFADNDVRIAKGIKWILEE